MPYDDRYTLHPFSVPGDAQGQPGSGCCGSDGKHCPARNGAQPHPVRRKPWIWTVWIFAICWRVNTPPPTWCTPSQTLNWCSRISWSSFPTTSMSRGTAAAHRLRSNAFAGDGLCCNLIRENAKPGSPRAARLCAAPLCRMKGCCTKNGVAASFFRKNLHKRQKNLLLELLMYQICAILLDVSP